MVGAPGHGYTVAQSVATTTSNDNVVGVLDAPGMKEARSGVWHRAAPVRRPHSTWHADTTAQDR